MLKAPTLNEIEQRLQQLTNAVLAGKAEETKQSTHAALARGSNTNDILDALVEAVDILVDLHEVGEYDQAKITASEIALNSCLQVIEEKLASSEGKFNLKAAVGPVGLKAGNLLSTALAALLRSVGFRSVNLGKAQTPLDILRNSEELGVDLVIALLPKDGVEGHLRIFLDEIDRGGFKSKFEIIPLAPGLGSETGRSYNVARNSSEAISKAIEYALRRQAEPRGELS